MISLSDTIDKITDTTCSWKCGCRTEMIDVELRIYPCGPRCPIYREVMRMSREMAGRKIEFRHE